MSFDIEEKVHVLILVLASVLDHMKSSDAVIRWTINLRCISLERPSQCWPSRYGLQSYIEVHLEMLIAVLISAFRCTRELSESAWH